MILYPAIDLHNGQVVRLLEGDITQQTVFSDDPLTIAQRWVDEGAAWLHIVNLDGAFGQASLNLQVLEAICQLGVPVQFGGGVRSLAQLEKALKLGVQRVILGTVALQQPQVVLDALTAFGAEAVCVGLDARDGYVATHGWQTASEVTPIELGNIMAGHGVRHALYTNVNRDGRMSGADISGTAALATATGLSVIASGGVNSLDDLRALQKTGVIAGAVTGMALYTGAFSLAAALAALVKGE